MINWETKIFTGMLIKCQLGREENHQYSCLDVEDLKIEITWRFAYVTVSSAYIYFVAFHSFFNSAVPHIK